VDIQEHIKTLKSYEDNNQWIFIRLRLANPVLIQYCDDFIEMKKKKVTRDVLSNIKKILVYCKTIADVDKYTCPYEDDMYDLILSKYKQFAPEPFGLDSIGLANVKYKYKKLAGTLDKVHHIFESEKIDKKDTRPSLQEFMQNDVIGNKTIRVLLNRKEDGASVVVEFVLKGKVYIAKRAMSRGRKDYGEGSDVSPIVEGLQFDAKPMKEALGFMPEEIGVQYELEVSNKHKTELEEYRNSKTPAGKPKETFANNRSAATGLMRKLIFASGEELKELRKFVSLVPVGFELQGVDKDKAKNVNWEDLYSAITQTFIYGDIETGYTIFEGTVKDVLKFAREYADTLIKTRGDLNHDIDGMVMTILDKSIQKELGRVNNINRYQVAFKFPEEVKKTKIIGLITTTGAFGYKEFLAETETVLLNGTKQNKGQFHSLAKFAKFDPRIGDEVFLKLSGDVIPFLFVDETCRKGDGKKLKLPTHCDCGTELIETKSKLRCPNEKCEFRIIGALYTFLVEVNAKGIGDETCKLIYKELGIKTASDMLKLKAKDFMKLTGFAEESSKLAEQTIQDILTIPKRPDVILSSLGIDLFRSSTARKVLDTYPLIDIIDTINSKSALDKLTMMLKTVKGIDKNASVIAMGLIDKFSELEKLLNVLSIDQGTKFVSDKVILVSGIRQDDELESLANKNGYEIKFSGKKYDILIIKDKKSMTKTKAIDAKNQGKPIYTRDEFMVQFK
jgi:NAD-dependent DNA ligase